MHYLGKEQTSLKESLLTSTRRTKTALMSEPDK
jgi:hypothetical protein